MRCRLRGYHLIYCGTFHFICLIKSLRANPISLAATFGISVDFFLGYLYVSVLVCLLVGRDCCISRCHLCKWVSHSESQTQRLLPNLGLSQVSTPFIASDCQRHHTMYLSRQPYNPKGSLVFTFTFESENKLMWQLTKVLVVTRRG